VSVAELKDTAVALASDTAAAVPAREGEGETLGLAETLSVGDPDGDVVPAATEPVGVEKRDAVAFAEPETAAESETAAAVAVTAIDGATETLGLDEKLTVTDGETDNVATTDADGDEKRDAVALTLRETDDVKETAAAVAVSAIDGETETLGLDEKLVVADGETVEVATTDADGVE
jgi:hypothetical protein